MKRTPLYDVHVASGAKMVPFGGWEMPIEYKGILKEHAATREKMGIFDVSHMGEIEVKGKDALAYSQKISCNDVSVLKPGKIQYSAILNLEGGVIDDCTIYCMSEDFYLFVVNAGHKDEVLSWMQTQAKDFRVEVIDRSADYGLIALQGKLAEELLQKVTGRDITSLQYFEWTWLELAGVAMLVSRTGYTGEDGFELYVPWNETRKIWSRLMEMGAPLGLEPIGLGARDTLRLEMGYLLSGTDMNPKVNAIEAGLSWICKLEKGSFNGKKAVEERKKSPTTLIRAVKMVDKAIPRSHYAVFKDPEGKVKIGEVTSGTFSPTLKAGIALTAIKNTFKIDDDVYIECRAGKFSKGKIVKLPFVKGSVKK